MSKEDILAIISGGENAAVEFKEAVIKPESLAKEIIAFSNTQGGTILFGVNDQSEVKGVQTDFNFEEWTMNIARNNVIPSTNIECSTYHIEGKPIIAIQVPKGKDRPYQTLQGKSGSAIRIFLFDNRIEFISPGRLPNTVTIEKLIAGVSFSINPVIVKFMENLRYIDKIGRGLPMVYQSAKQLGKTVQFKEIGEEFRVVLAR